MMQLEKKANFVKQKKVRCRFGRRSSGDITGANIPKHVAQPLLQLSRSCHGSHHNHKSNHGAGILRREEQLRFVGALVAGASMATSRRQLWAGAWES
jgi:hypothetical protein